MWAKKLVVTEDLSLQVGFRIDATQLWLATLLVAVYLVELLVVQF
jgi:hypothetical protein